MVCYFLSCLASGHMKTAMEHATEEFDDLSIEIAEFQYRKVSIYQRVPFGKLT